MADEDDNQSIIDALKQPAQFSNKQFFPQRPEGAVSDWMASQGGKVKSALEDIFTHPENMVGPGELGIIAGPMANTAKMGAFKDAIQQLMKKSSPEEMFDKTGWFPRSQGELGFEISDKGLMTKPLPKGIGAISDTMYRNPHTGRVSGGFSDFASHPEAFAAYPQLQDVPVHVDPSYGPENRAIFGHPLPGHITIGGSVNPRGLAQEQESSLMHEAQHFIQEQENWPYGAGPRDYGERIYKYYDKLPPDHPLNEEVKRWLVGKNPQNVPFKMYQMHPSEVEARNVQERLRNSKYGKPLVSPDVTSYQDVADALKKRGVALDESRSGYRPYQYGMRKWKTGTPVLPEDLDPESRALFNKLSTHTDLYTGKPVRSITSHYPWQSEDIPRNQQYDYWKYFR